MSHHPYVHMIVPGGGIAPDGSRWVSSRSAFLFPVRVLGELLRRFFLTRVIALHDTGRLSFFGSDRAPHRSPVIPAPPGAAPDEALGGLFQGTLRRTGGGARLSVALHAPGRHLEHAPHPFR